MKPPFLLLFLILLLCKNVSSHHVKMYTNPGDLNLGALLTINGPDLDGPGCSDRIYDNSMVEFTEAIAYAVQRINDDNKLLKNVRLGFVILDTCKKESITIVQAMKFLPFFLKKPTNETANKNLYNFEYDANPQTIPNWALGHSREYIQKELAKKDTKPAFQFHVEAILGPEFTALATASGSLFEVYNIPQVSPTASGRSLSDSVRYNHFFRTITTDNFQASAIQQFALFFNWTYISLVHDQGNYGSGLLRQMYQATRATISEYLHGEAVCIAKPFALGEDSSRYMYYRTAETIQELTNMKVVVVMLYKQEAHELLKTMYKKYKNEFFVFIFSEVADNGEYFKGIEHILQNPTFEFITTAAAIYDNSKEEQEKYERYMTDIREGKTLNNNPWIQTLEDRKNMIKVDYRRAAFYIDSVNVIARALNKSLATCMDKMHVDKMTSELVEKFKDEGCFSNENVTDAIAALNFKGNAKQINFDKCGDVQFGSYLFNYIMVENGEIKKHPIAEWKSQVKSVRGCVNTIPQVKGTIATFSGLSKFLKTSNLFNQTFACGEPCGALQVYVPFGNSKCCWKCQGCPKNSRREDANDSSTETKCKTCEPLTWLDDENICQPITRTYIEWTNLVAILCSVLAILGIILCILTIIAIAYYKSKSRLIRGSSPEICYIILFGALMGFGSTFLFFGDKTNTLCFLREILYNLSGTFTYGAILVKISRIYRIFNASAKFKKSLKYASLKAQVVFILILVAIQLAIQGLIFATDEKSTMEDYQRGLEKGGTLEKYVERICKINLFPRVVPVTFNGFVLFFSTYFAFKTRKVPDNFNECFHVFLIVTLTIFLWLIYTPTYFMLYRFWQKEILQVLSVILDSYVVVCVLFGPKIYATVLLEESQQLVYLRDSATGQIYTAQRSTTADTQFLDVHTEVALTHEKEKKPRLDSTSNTDKVSDVPRERQPIVHFN